MPNALVNPQSSHEVAANVQLATCQRAEDEVPKTRLAKSPRLMSLDALRGFDMFWILGGEGIFAALLLLTGWQGWHWFDAQMQHSAWHGFSFYDLIFPLFIFLSGIALGLAPKYLNNMAWPQRIPIYKHAVKRLFLLVCLGILYNHGWGGGIPMHWDEVRYASVLGRIGFAWFFCAMLVWHTRLPVQMMIAVAMLLAYACLQSFPPLTLDQSGALAVTGSINAYIDTQFLPGITYQNRAVDPEGILSTFPAIINGLIGVFVGQYIRRSNTQPKHESQWLQVILLAFISGLFIAAGECLSLILPINKDLWTSSFVLVSSGWSLLLFSFFFCIVDVLKWRAIAFPFVVIGCNAIIIYLASSLINWQYLVQSLFGGVLQTLPIQGQALSSVVALLFVQWAILYWMYQRKIFIKI